MKAHSSEYRLLSGLFFKLLPYQILLLIVNAANSIVDSLHASNFIGKTAMSAMGLYASMDHFLYALSIMLVSGSQLLCARFLGKNQKKSVEGIFSIDLIFSAILSLATTLVLVIGALTDVLHGLIPNDVERAALNQYMLVIPEGFGAGEKDRIDISVRKIDEVVDVSRQVIAFCAERGIDERRSNFAGLAMEEMAGNVVDHGFTKDKKEHSIDIRVTHRKDDVILRLRDNCIPFNPSEAAALMAPADGMKNVGIRIVYSLTTEIKYQNLLGTNVLTIRM